MKRTHFKQGVVSDPEELGRLPEMRGFQPQGLCFVHYHSEES